MSTLLSAATTRHRPYCAVPSLCEAFLGADRTLDKHVSFSEWSLLSKIKRRFHKKARHIEEELRKKYDEIIGLFDEVEGFTEFAEGFKKAFSELQADTPEKLGIEFKP